MKCLQGHAMYDMYGMSVFCFHFIINSAGFEKNSVVFFSFVVRFRLVILFYSYFSICWLDFFPNIRFSNRSDYSIALSLSLRVIWSFLVVRIACFTWKTFLCLNCCFTSFSSLKPYINAPPPQINTMHQVFIFLDCWGKTIKASCVPAKEMYLSWVM